MLAASSKKTEKESDLELKNNNRKRERERERREGDDDEEEEAFNPADWANLMKSATQKDKLDDDDVEHVGGGHDEVVFDSNASPAGRKARRRVPRRRRRRRPRVRVRGFHRALTPSPCNSWQSADLNGGLLRSSRNWKR